MNPLLEEYGEDITLKRPGSGSYVNGNWTPGTPTISTIFAAVLPPGKTDQTDIAAAGLEDKDVKIIYTEVELRKTNEKTKGDRDVIVWRGQEYVIEQVIPRYQIEDLAHFKCLATLKGS